MGGFIHVLLVIAIVVVLLRVISGRSALKSPPSEPRFDIAPETCRNARRDVFPAKRDDPSTPPSTPIPRAAL